MAVLATYFLSSLRVGVYLIDLRAVVQLLHRGCFQLLGCVVGRQICRLACRRGLRRWSDRGEIFDASWHTGRELGTADAGELRAEPQRWRGRLSIISLKSEGKKFGDQSDDAQLHTRDSRAISPSFHPRSRQGRPMTVSEAERPEKGSTRRWQCPAHVRAD